MADLVKDYQELISAINEQYEAKMQTIKDLQQKIVDTQSQLDKSIDQGLKATTQRLNKKLDSYKAQLKIYQETVEKWFESQKQTAMDRMNAATKKVQDKISARLQATTELIKKQKENQLKMKLKK